jgi:hypothetical protein
MGQSHIAALLVVAAAATLSACTPLTANAPLFSVADQIGPPPLSEGRWVGLDEDKCTRAMATRHGGPASGCVIFTVRHLPDGAWQLYGEGDDEHGKHHTMNVRFVITPATETASPDAYSPLYLAEYQSSNIADDPPPANAPSSEVQYAMLAPIGTLPATELFFIAEIQCDSILRDGPIDGISQRHGDDGSQTGCVASSQQAVREAARRALVNGIARIDSDRLIYVGPEPTPRR